jgi:dipeptidase D
VCEGGLEAANISVKKSNMDIISIGPNVVGAHTPQEKIEVSSTEKLYEIILKTLKSIK